MPFGRILEHLANPAFSEGELRKFSVVGFSRSMTYNASAAYRRAHVYSAFLLNVRRLLWEQRINFRQDLFIWEDLELHCRAVDVVKCQRFAMRKQQYQTGGCSQHVARSANPLSGREEIQASVRSPFKSKPLIIELN